MTSREVTGRHELSRGVTHGGQHHGQGGEVPLGVVVAPLGVLSPAVPEIDIRARTRTRMPQDRVTWPEVLRVLPDPAAQSYAVTLYNAHGFLPDDMSVNEKAHGTAGRRRRRARAAMADALARTEDLLEIRRRHSQRLAVRAVRRRLEAEVWP